MSSFLSKSACAGRRPSLFNGFSGVQRPHLVARLLRERNVARFIVAPHGYGKTSLALEYAETIMSWVRVFWVRCDSPCFVRDLDAGLIASEILRLDGQAALAVFDDVPLLDDARAQAFSREIDRLLQKGCEVVVTCTPLDDSLGSLQRDRVRIGSRDMLLTDEEVDRERTPEARAKEPAADLPAARRVPALVWGRTADARSAFLRACLSPDLPGDLLLASAGMLVLRSGSVDALHEICASGGDDLRDLLEDYPHWGFDPTARTFEAPSSSPDELGGAIKPRLDGMVASGGFESRAHLVCTWGDALIAAGDAARACDTVRAACPRRACGPWVAGHALELVRQGCFYPGLKLVQAARAEMRSAARDVRARADVYEAVCLRVLGDVRSAVRVASRFAFAEDAPDGARICCQLILARNGSEPLRSRAVDALAARGAGKAGAAEEASFFPALASAWAALEESPDALGERWVVLRALGTDPDALNLAASWLYSARCTAVAEGAAGSFPEDDDHLVVVEEFVRGSLEGAQDDARPGFFALSAGLAMERAHVQGMEYAFGPLSTAMLVTMRNAEMTQLSQQALFDRDVQEERLRHSNWSEASAGVAVEAANLALASKLKRTIPVLTLRLFGRFEASIGDAPIDQDLLKRQSVRSLLVLLAVNQGREMSRESLYTSMWPASTRDVARKNFYSVWSQLRRALSLPDGTCPYLVRHQYGCSLEGRYVHNDAMRLNEICRELLFGMPDLAVWSALYAEIDRDYSCDLLPSERNNELVETARLEYRARLVDALVAATQSIVQSGNPQWGVWFARAALNRDETREDAHVALMRAQIASDQRTAAMMSYHNCRRILAERLGVDPTPETVALYESLLE